MTNKTVYIFPGQGSQFIGMGADLARDFAEAKDVFSEIDEALHQNLSALMFSGELAELTQTQNAQPAIMAVSMAVWRVLQANSAVNVDAVAGHSLGEYSALCAADVLSLSETAQLLQARGQAMARACNQQKGGMLALLGATVEQAAEIAKASDCYVANDNAPEKMVIKRAIPLSVAGAFHSPLMQSAADEMAPVLAKVKFAEPKIPVFFNVTANIDADPMHYADLLTRQITAPVRWRELIENTNATRFVECGPGNVLCGLVRRIVPEAENVALGTTESIKSFPGK